MSSIDEQIQALLPWGIAHRRHLHRHPELSHEEKATSDYCAGVLRELGYAITPSWEFGFTADLTVGNASKRIALRADMDALPIQEKNNHDFVSTFPGKTHACGHDGHMAVALTTARFLAEHQELLPCHVRFIFQPSEERAPGGALGMIEKGCLQDVNEVYGLHNDPGTAVGKIRTRVGALMAAADLFELTIRGRGCHAARPHDGLDPVIVGAQLIIEWQSIMTRRINPVHPAVLSVTQFKAGDVFNVIPDTAYLAGTLRTFDKKDRALIRELMQIALNAVEKQGYGINFNYIEGYDTVVNHKFGVDRVVRAASEIVGPENVDASTEPEGWAEDFCYYLQHCPGAFYFLGSGNAEKNITAPLHSSRYDFDETAIAIGAAVMTTLVLQA